MMQALNARLVACGQGSPEARLYRLLSKAMPNLLSQFSEELTTQTTDSTIDSKSTSVLWFLCSTLWTSMASVSASLVWSHCRVFWAWPSAAARQLGDHCVSLHSNLQQQSPGGVFLCKHCHCEHKTRSKRCHNELTFTPHDTLGMSASLCPNMLEKPFSCMLCTCADWYARQQQFPCAAAFSNSSKG